MEQPTELLRCTCCGAACDGSQHPRGHRIPQCMRCAGGYFALITCPRLHGDDLELAARKLVANGSWSPWHAIAQCLIDDAQLCGVLELVLQVDRPQLLVRKPPRRWEVVACRAACRGEAASTEDVLGAVVAAHWGRPRTPEVLLEIRRELAEAIAATIGDVVNLEIDVYPDPGDGQAFVANCTVRVGAQVTPPGEVDTDGQVGAAPEVVVEATPAPSGDSAVDALAKVLPFRGRAEA